MSLTQISSTLPLKLHESFESCQQSLSSNDLMNWWNFAFMSGLVNISAGFLSVGTYLTTIFLFSTASQTKWYHILMCLVQVWNLLSFDNMIAPWLSQLSVTRLLNPWISWTNVCKYIASFAAWVWVMYSASVLNNTMIYCFFELQVMAPMPIWNKYPKIKCLCGCPTQSASQYPSRIMFPWPLKVSHRFFVFPR